MMFFIQPLYAFFALLIAFVIYQYIRYVLAHEGHNDDDPDGADRGADSDLAREGAPILARPTQPKADWRSGIRFQQARSSLLALEDGDFSFKYWRPFFLFLCKLDVADGTYVPQAGMINLIAQLMRRGKGLAIVGGVIIGELRDHWEAADQARAKLKAKLRDAKIEGFPEVVVARSESEGHLLLVQCKGLGVLRPNAVMIGWPARVRAMAEAQRREFTSFIEDVALSGKTIVACKGAVGFPKDGDALTGAPRARDGPPRRARRERAVNASSCLAEIRR